MWGQDRERVHHRAKQGGGRLKLAEPIERIRELLSIAKLDTVFEVFDTEPAALESFC